MSKEILDATIIGAGPKGISTALEFEGKKIKTTTLDVRFPGQTWSPKEMNPKFILNSYGWEITNHQDKSFSAFSNRTHTKEYLKRHPLNENQYTALHYHHYLQWLGSKINYQQGKVLNIHKTAGGLFEINSKNIDTGFEVTRTKCVIIASGLIGFGGKEFINDPTGLLQTSPRVEHFPLRIKNKSDIEDFIAGASNIAIVGGGIASGDVLRYLQGVKGVKNIKIIATNEVDKKKSEVPWTHDHNNQVVSRIKPEDIPLFNKDVRVTFYPKTRVVSAEEIKDKINISTDSGEEILVDRIIIAAGYNYDFKKIPFNRELISKGLVSLSGRYPQLNRNFNLFGKDGDLSIYVLGEGAMTLGEDQRWLTSTAKTVQKISESIVNNIL